MTQVNESWLVVLTDPRTGSMDSFGPYSRDEAARLQYWCTAELDFDDLGDVVVQTARVRT